MIAAGADGVAVISALSLAPDPRQAARGSARGRRRRAGKAGRRMTAIAVTIAGSDSSGGAGIQADLKTFAALGVYGASVIAALTAQNTQGVTAIHDVPAGFHRRADRRGVFRSRCRGGQDRHAVATPAIEAVARGLMRHKAKNIVLDPVMVATSGDRADCAGRGRRAAPPADPARADGDAESAGSGRADRREPCAQRAGNGSAGARDIELGRAPRADQRRPRRRRRERRSADRRGRCRAACRPSASPPTTPTAPAARCRRRSPPALPRASISPPPCTRPRLMSPRPSPPPTNLKVGHGHGPLNHFYAQWRTP